MIMRVRELAMGFTFGRLPCKIYELFHANVNCRSYCYTMNV